MEDQVILSDNKVVRHCAPAWFDEDGQLTSSAFHLKDGEESLSVYWVDYYDDPDEEDRLNNVRKELGSARTVRKSHKLAIILVGVVQSYVHNKSGSTRDRVGAKTGFHSSSAL